MKMRISFLLTAWLIAACGHAQEGMWIPSKLDDVIGDMKAKGLKLDANDLYSAKGSSLKDAIVWFDMGCTGEFVSNQGLLFTNHHCGFDYIQSHSTVENDYLTHGYWAKSLNEEKPCPGLTISMVESIVDVSNEINAKLKGSLPEERSAKLAALKMEYAKLAGLPEGQSWAVEGRGAFGKEWQTADGAYASFIREYNYGTQFYRIVLKTYRDVRWVGAPPSDIGKFGGDTDNWVWPRHTGDFSVFRVYADKNNEPADYNAGNQPYQPKQFLTINAKGINEGDYTMVYGFPGRTEHFLPSPAVEFMVNDQLPLRIGFRDVAMRVLKERMESSDKIRIQYAAKQSSVANAYIKWKGQLLGLKKFDVVNMKKEQEGDLAKRTNIQPVKDVDSLYREYGAYILATSAYSEFMGIGPELFRFSMRAKEWSELAKKDTWTKGLAEEKWSEVAAFYKDFDPMTERDMFFEMAPLLVSKVSGRLEGQALRDALVEAEDDWGGVLYNLYEESVFMSEEKLRTAFMKGDFKIILNDPVYKMAIALDEQHATIVAPKYKVFSQELEKALQAWVNIQTAQKTSASKWCDANSTLRVTYGKVGGSHPKDGVTYDFKTTTDGILQKNASGNPDFYIHPQLDSLYRNHIFGSYASNGTMPVCYTGSNHTTGGNSGSPALNDKGELVGINFDRSWESTMSDVYFNPAICRNIMVDIRYVLWVIDVYANADRLLDEMKIVR